LSTAGAADAAESGYTVLTARSFDRAAKRFFRTRQPLRPQFAAVEAVLTLLAIDPHTPSLHTHPLHGALDGYWGVRLTQAERIVITIRVTEREVELLDIGSHKEVY